MRIRQWLAVVLLTAITLSAVPSHALAAPIDWAITLTSDSLVGRPGQPIVFDGAINNATGSELFLDFAFLDFTPIASNASFVVDYTDEFLSTLGIIPLGGYSGSLFYLTWGNEAVPDTIGTGIFELTALAADPPTISQTFTAAVQSATVPEPSTVALFGGGLLIHIGRRVRRRIRRPC